MKPAAALLFFSFALPAVAQSAATSPKSTPRPAVHHTATAAHPAVPKTACDASDPVLDPKIPRIEGFCKPLYTLKYIDISAGTGPMAETHKWITVHYTGYLPDGTKFDSSLDRGEPITFPYGAHQVITGWDTGFEGMKVGGKRRLLIPYQLAYGETGRPPTIPAKTALVFDVELLGLSDSPPPQKPAPGQPGQGQPGQPAQGQPAAAKPAETTAPPADPSKAPATTPAKPLADPTKPTATPPAASAPAKP